MADGDQGSGDAAAVDGPAEEEQGPTERELREIHSRHRQLVEYLVQQGYQPEDPVRAAAEAQAESSKRLWDEAKPAKAVTLRMRWAEEALNRARKNQAKMEQSIDELDRDYEAKRLDWTQQLNALRAKTREREDKLAAVARQAAVEFGSADNPESSEPLREAANVLETTVTPTVVGLLEQIPSDNPAREHVERVVAILKGVQGTVERASRERWADVYDIGDQEDGSWECGDDYQEEYHDGHAQHRWGSSRWDEHQDGGYGYDGWGSTRPRWWAAASGGAEGDGMDTSESRAPAWLGTNQADAAYARANKRRACEGDDPNGMQGRHAGAMDGDTEIHEDAARSQAAASHAAMEVDTRPAPPTPTAEEHAALEGRRREAWDLAQDQGVQVSYETIAAMASEELEEWTTANLM